MAFDSEKFIIDLAKQLNLLNMDDATRTRLQDLKDNGVATKKQQGWDLTKPVPKIGDVDPDDPSKYAYTGDTVAPGSEPGVADLKDLYLKLVVIMRDIQADKELRENDPTKKFLNDFYGPGKAIETYTISAIPEPAGIAKYIDSNKEEFVNFFNGEIKEKDLDKLISTLNDDSYKSDTKSLKTLDTFLKRISYYAQWGGDKPLPGKDIPACLGSDVAGDADLDTKSIEKIRKKLDSPIVPSLDTFSSELSKLCGKLIADDELRKKFMSKDSDGDFSSWVNKGLSESNYKDGDHALAPKYSNRKKFWKRAQDNVKDWYVDTLGKLNEKHTRHIYSTEAKFIVPELIGKGVKPTDGTKKILETLDAINGNLPNPVHKKVKWIKETMDKMSKTDFFGDALKDGKQMRQLVQEIIKAAVHDGKKDEAKVALEMLAVMRYTMTSSSVRDKLNSEPLNLFSDGGYSWNKNEGMQMVTKAIDKTINFGMMAAFEVGNLVKNAYNQNGLKFKEGTGRLDKRTKDSAEYKDAGKKADMEELFAFWDFVNSSANTKDYNIFVSHKKRQKAADMENKFNTYYGTHSIGR